MNVDIISRLIQQVNSKNLSDNLFYLAKDPLPCRKLNYTVPGHSLNTLYETDKFIKSKLESYKYNVQKEGVKVQAYGCDISKLKSLQYALPPSDSTWYTAYNLYAKKRGKNLSYKTIVVVSHKDSQSWVDSPGAYDNAAGVAGSMEIARILADYESKHSIWFLYCNEEHTPWTSITAANNAKKRGENLIAIFNLDGIGGKSQKEADAGIKSNVALYYNREGKQLANLMEEVNSAYKIGLTLKKM